MNKIHYFDEVTSTIDVAKEMAVKGCEHFTAVIAASQTKGRGRQGNEWHSLKHTGLYMSVVLKPKGGLSEAALFPMLAPVAVCQAVSETTGLATGIKWPNDVIANKKKLSGILVESSITDGVLNYAVLSMGINVNNQEFPNELKEKATSLLIETKTTWSIQYIGEVILNKLKELEQNEDIHGKYKKLCLNIGRKVLVKKGAEIYTATAVDILQSGELEIILENGKKTAINSAEVSIRGENGYL